MDSVGLQDCWADDHGRDGDRGTAGAGGFGGGGGGGASKYGGAGPRGDAGSGGGNGGNRSGRWVDEVWTPPDAGRGGGGGGMGGAIFNHGGAVHVASSEFADKRAGGGDGGPNSQLVPVEKAVAVHGASGFGDATLSRTVTVCNDVCNGGACEGEVVRCDDGDVCTSE